MSNLNNYFAKAITFDEIMANFKRLISLNSNRNFDFSYEQSLDDSVYIVDEENNTQNFFNFSSIINSSRDRSFFSLDRFYTKPLEAIYNTKSMKIPFFGGNNNAKVDKLTDEENYDLNAYKSARFINEKLGSGRIDNSDGFES